MKVKELRRFLLNKPDDLEITVQYVIVYKDKGISIDLRGDEKYYKLQGKLDKAKEALIMIANRESIDCTDCSSNNCDPYGLYECAVETAKKYLKDLKE